MRNCIKTINLLEPNTVQRNLHDVFTFQRFYLIILLNKQHRFLIIWLILSLLVWPKVQLLVRYLLDFDCIQKLIFSFSGTRHNSASRGN